MPTRTGAFLGRLAARGGQACGRAVLVVRDFQYFACGDSLPEKIQGCRLVVVVELRVVTAATMIASRKLAYLDLEAHPAPTLAPFPESFEATGNPDLHQKPFSHLLEK